MLRDANYRLPTAVTLRRFLMAAAIAGLALLTALWSVAPPARRQQPPVYNVAVIALLRTGTARILHESQERA